MRKHKHKHKHIRIQNVHKTDNDTHLGRDAQLHVTHTLYLSVILGRLQRGRHPGVTRTLNL